ncbi:MAG TPA: hypothetical protein VHB27_09810, partial [Rhodopila sp.]|uniref:hypothetical protein n=1 Tax=Rhodopila sp. TaxID=2480087 RepID=UPI002B5474B3
GLAPLADTPGNRFASDAALMDYAALGLYVLASNVPAYRGSLADGPAGRLVANRTEAWYAAISGVIRDQALRQAGYDRSRSAFLTLGTLAGQKARRRDALERAVQAVDA